MYGKNKTHYHRVVSTCEYGKGKQKLIGCLVGLGNLLGTQLLSGMTGRVRENSIYIRPS